VNIAARIAGVAGPGQVFVGEPVVDVVAPDGFRFVDAGAFPLKGIAEPVRIFEAITNDG
jgi:class 3 adenylate cyclase